MIVVLAFHQAMILGLSLTLDIAFHSACSFRDGSYNHLCLYE